MNIFNEFLKLFKEHGLEWFQRYYSVYPGIVTDNNDPEKRGRIKVICPTVLGPDRVLAQWLEPVDQKMAGKGYGEFFPPEPKDLVHVMFENGDINYPVYMGGYYARGELPSDFQTGYPNVRGWIFKNGHKILVDSNSGSAAIKIIHSKGSQVLMNPDGSITVQSPGKVDVEAGGDCVVNASGKVNVTAGGDVNVTAGGNAVVEASEIHLNGSGGKVLTTETDPVVDLITGAPTQGVDTVKAGT